MMRSSRARRLMLTGLVLISAAGLAHAVILDSGRIRLELHEGIGRFTLGYREAVTSSRFQPLFYDRDPRTSAITILQGNRTLRLGEAGAFTEEITERSDGIGFRWTSSTLIVELNFTFTASQGAALSDAVVATLRMENISEAPVNLGARVLLDTDLGEQSGPHFRVSGIGEIDRETELTPSPAIWYWRSESGDNGPGLQQTLYGPGITVPSRVVMANWKRLSDASYDFQVTRNRNFNQLPYSVNDSAVAVYYDGQIVAAGETRDIVMVFGSPTGSGYALGGATSGTGINSILDQVTATAGESLSPSEEILRINDLVDQIDRLLATGQPITADDLAVIEQILAQLEERRTQFGQ